MHDNNLEILKSMTILVVEDTDDARLLMKTTLAKHAKQVFEAQDGMDGLELFNKESIDIVVTDISMPNMDGLQMSKAIREHNQDVPIIVQTAFDDTSFMMQSIDIGVNKYLNKPVSVKKLLDAVRHVAQEIENRRLAVEYKAKIEQEKLAQNTQAVLKQLADVLIEPLIIVQQNAITYCNKAFENAAGTHLKAICANMSTIDSLLDSREGFCARLSDVGHDNNKISVTIDKKRRIYQVIVKTVRFNTQEHESIIYVFEDITKLEYQSLKIKNYSTRLEEIVIKSKYQAPKDTTSKSTPTRSPEEEALLRKSHIDKLSAQEFIAGMDSSVYEDIQELQELASEMDEALRVFVKEQDTISLMRIIDMLALYAKALKRTQEFDELALALEATAEVLNRVEMLDATHVATIDLYMRAIFEDLQTWITSVFEHQESVDIHYLDASLFSSCLQLEVYLTQSQSDDDEDVEFF